MYITNAPLGQSGCVHEVKTHTLKGRNSMPRLTALCGVAAALVLATSAANVHAENRGRTLAVTMTNDQVANEIKVYDAATHALLQTLSTHGRGGAGGNARGITHYHGELLAVVNNGSNTVALFRRDNDTLRFANTVTTTSAP
jgi:hypothetical protein